MIKKILLLLLLVNVQLHAQIEKNVEVEVLGRPSWQMLIPLSDNGLLMFVKSDLTKASVFKFDKNLEKIWEKEIYLDAEDAPKAYTIADDHITLMFSETSGMYYQVFNFDLSTGAVKQDGFELREYFVDQDYVFLGDKVLMAGSNATGAAFFVHDFKADTSRLLESKDILGKVQVNEFQLKPETGNIEAIWSVKTMGYADEKKKKNEFVKDAFVVFATIDKEGNILNKSVIKQTGGKFPLDGRLLVLKNGEKIIFGTYQANSGDKGLYSYSLTSGTGLKTYSYTSLLSGGSPLQPAEINQLINSYTFLANPPLEGDDRLFFGGSFIKAQYQTVSEQDPNFNPYGNTMGNGFPTMNSSRGRTVTRTIFRGYHYPVGLVLELSPEGDLLMSRKIDINNISPQVQQALAYNVNGAVSYCLKGDLAANNFNIGTKPILYKLNPEAQVAGSKNTPNAFLPSYNEVKFWYDDYFIAEGSRSKIEAVSLNDNVDPNAQPKKRGLFGKKSKNTPASYAQIRKIIY